MTQLPEQPNYDESKIQAYSLPAPLTFENGEKVLSAADWPRRRAEILKLFEDQMFGCIPGSPGVQRHECIEQDTQALGGLATRKQVSIFFSQNELPRLDLLIYLPNQGPKPAPVFMGLNFSGNSTLHPDPAIRINGQWAMTHEDGDVTQKRATEASRGTAATRWPFEQILARGYGVVTACYGDLDPDYDDGFQNGVHPLFDLAHGRQGNSWGSLSAWAWGLSRMMDYLESEPAVDPRKVALLGHSRLGKAAVWAGACDERFAVVISNNSGCGGAALFRRKIGETAALINVRFPHWFCENFKQYNLREEFLPVDQHQLLALMAPRPIYVASATEDVWSDPHGEFLAAKHASPVYELLGFDRFGAEEMPAPDQPVMSRIGYHLRTGKHDVTLYDWQRYMDFADEYMK